MISQTFFKEWQEARKRADDYEKIVNDAIHNVVTFWCDTFDIDLECWYFYGAGEGEVGNINIDNRNNEDIITGLVVEVKKFQDVCNNLILDKNGNMFCLLDGAIPLRWLFEGFENEILDGKTRYEEKVAKQKAKELQKKNRKNKLAKTAAKKLSKRELQALKATLRKK